MSVPHSRQFSTSPLTNKLFAHVVRRRVKQEDPIKVGDPIYRLNKPVLSYPPYPYGEATLYKQSNKGLYGGKIIQFGHKISEFKNRNVRTFKPNVNWQKLWSETLKRPIQIKVVGSVLKTITKEGGIDNYLTKDKSARIKELGPAGWKLRYEVLMRREAQRLAKPQVVDNIMLPENPEKKIPIFAKFTTNDGDVYLITLGKNRLVEKLYEQSRLQSTETQQIPGTFTAFRSQYKNAAIEEIVSKLVDSGVELATIGIKETN